MKLHGYSYSTKGNGITIHFAIEMNNGYLVDNKFFVKNAENHRDAIKKVYPTEVDEDIVLAEKVYTDVYNLEDELEEALDNE